MKHTMALSKAELAREIGVSRAYVTMLANGKRKPSQEVVNKLHSLGVNISDMNADFKSVAGHLVVSRVGSTPIRSRHNIAYHFAYHFSYPLTIWAFHSSYPAIRSHQNYHLLSSQCLHYRLDRIVVPHQG